MNHATGFSCVRCGAVFPLYLKLDSRGCPHCSTVAPANLKVAYDRQTHSSSDEVGQHKLPSLWRYGDMLPVTPGQAITLGEGLTPLLSARNE